MPSFLNKERTQQIFTLSMPIIAGMVSQNVLNLIDTAMVGRLGPSALAATGIAGMTAFLVQSPLIGVTSAVQAAAARRKGESKLNETAFSLNTALIFTISFGLVVTILGTLLSEKIFTLLCSDIAVREHAVDYFNIRIAAAVFVVTNFAFRGYWNAIDLPKVYMNTLITMHITNIVLNYLLIFGKFGFPRMEVKGAALATSLSIVLGTIIYFLTALNKARANGFLAKLPSFTELKNLSINSLTNGSELFVTMTNVVALYWLVGKIGTNELAAINILMNVFLVTLLPAIGFGITLATLSGQALGRGDKDDAYNWGFDVMKLGFICFAVLALPFLIFPSLIMQIFTNDQGVIDSAVNALRIMGITLAFEMIGFIFLDGLKGLGDGKSVVKISFVMQWLLFFPTACALVFIFNYGLLEVWILQIIIHITQGIWFLRIWSKKEWQNIEVNH